MSKTAPKFASFSEFYPYYLAEHSQPLCRALHYVGSCLVLLLLAYIGWSEQWHLAWGLPIVGYGFAWVGHFFIEHNKPATFLYPGYSLMADWVMLFDFLTGRLTAKIPR